MKVCNKCKETKHKEHFARDCAYKSGHRSICKSCVNKYNSSEAGKKASQKYRLSEKGKSVRRRENKSEKNRIRQRKYSKTESSKRAHRKYAASPKGRARYNYLAAKRRAIKAHATPPWLTADQFKLIEMQYKLAYYMTMVTGIPHEVDHIIPLQGENITGLHVPWNLRVIPAMENLLKRNKLL